MGNMDDKDLKSQETAEGSDQMDFSTEFAVEAPKSNVLVNDASKPTMGICARMIAVFTKPKQLFAEMPAKSGWLIPVLVASVISLITTWMSLPKLREMMLAAMPANAGMSQAQIESIVKIQGISAVVMAGVAVAGGVFIMAALYHFLCVVSGGEGKYKQALTVVSYAGLIGALSLILRTILLYTIPGATFEQSFTSLAVVLPMDAPKSALNTILSSIELFSIWSLIVTSIGLTTLYKMKGKKAWVIVFATWIVFVGVSVALVAVFAPKTM